VNSPKAEGDERSEQRIFHDARHHLNTPGNHRLHQNSFHRFQVVCLDQTPANLLESLPDSRLARQIQADSTHLCFVDYAVGGQLHGYRKADSTREIRGFIRRHRYPSWGDW
jgi:hypothetical protein